MVPALVFLMFGMYDLANGWITRSRLTTATFAIGQVATTLAAQQDGTNSLTQQNAYRSSTAALAAMPQLSVTGTNYSVTLSGVVFSANSDCPKGSCVAKVSWSATLLGVGQRRPCTNLTSVSDTAAPSLTTLSADAFQANPILVVDMTYTFTPLFLQSFIGTIPMRSVAYFSPRSGVNRLTTDGTSDLVFHYTDLNDPTVQCP